MDEFPLICALATNLLDKGEHIEFRTAAYTSQRWSGTSATFLQLVCFERTRGGGTKMGTRIVYYVPDTGFTESFFTNDELLEHATLTYPDGKWVLALPD